MRDTNFKAGDKVRIRPWEDMEKEFGLDESGDIKCKYTFTLEMKKYCGTEFTLKEVSRYGEVRWNGKPPFSFSPDMIEKVEDEPDWTVKQKPITSVEECEEIFEAYKNCHEYESCEDCPVYKYEREGSRKGGDCKWVQCQAREFMENLKKEEVPVPEKPLPPVPDLPEPPETEKEIESIEECIELYKAKRNCNGTPCGICLCKKYGDCDQAIEKCLHFALQHVYKTPKPKPPEEVQIHITHHAPGENQCKDCAYRKEIGEGFLFCTWFHNTTVPHGYCHNYNHEVKELKNDE